MQIGNLHISNLDLGYVLQVHTRDNPFATRRHLLESSQCHCTIVHMDIVRAIDLTLGVLQTKEITSILSIRKDKLEESVLLIGWGDGMHHLQTEDVGRDNDRLGFAQVLTIYLCLYARSEATTRSRSRRVWVVVVRMYRDSTCTLCTQTRIRYSLNSECVGTRRETHIHLDTSIYQLLVQIPVNRSIFGWSDCYRVI